MADSSKPTSPHEFQADQTWTPHNNNNNVASPRKITLCTDTHINYTLNGRKYTAPITRFSEWVKKTNATVDKPATPEIRAVAITEAAPPQTDNSQDNNLPLIVPVEPPTVEHPPLNLAEFNNARPAAEPITLIGHHWLQEKPSRDVLPASERTLVLIDAKNVLGNARQLGDHVDFRRLDEYLIRRTGWIIRKLFYTDLTDAHTKPLANWLDYNGYAVRYVNNNPCVQMAIDTLGHDTTRLSHVILFSGDAQLTPLVEELRRRGIAITLVSSIKTATPADDLLRRACDGFIELQNILPQIKRPNQPPNKLVNKSDAHSAV